MALFKPFLLKLLTGISQGIPCDIPVNSFNKNGLNKAIFCFEKLKQGNDKEYRVNDKLKIEINYL